MIGRMIGGLMLAAMAAAAPAAPTASSEEAEVVRAVQALVDSWREADSAKGDSVLHPEFRLTTRRPVYDGDDPALAGRSPHVGVSTRDDMMKIYQIAQPGSWDDRLSDISVRVDPSGVASLSARYRFFIGGELSHCGAVSFQLYRMQSGWQIVSFADTHQWARDGHCRDGSG